MPFNTDTQEFAKAVAEFEATLPGFWWSVGMCSLGAHASCAVDAKSNLMAHVVAGEPLDTGFHCDATNGEDVTHALRDVMRQAVEFLSENPKT